MINSKVLLMEFRRSYVSLLVWSLAIGFTMLLVLVLYPMVKDFYSNIPDEYREMLEMFGGIPTNIVEYYATEGAMMLQMFGAIFAALLGFNALSREERERSHDIMYSLPVSRKTYFYTKLLSVIIQVVIFALVVTVISIFGFILVEKVNLGRFILFSFLNLLLLLIIAIFSFCLVGFLKSGIRSGIALIVPLPLYILTIVATVSTNELLQKLKYLTPFTFSEPVSLLKQNSSIEYISLIVFIGLSIFLLVMANKRFIKKDFSA